MSPANYLVVKTTNTIDDTLNGFNELNRAQQCVRFIQICELITPKYLNELLDKDNPKWSRKKSIIYAISMLRAFEKAYKTLHDSETITDDELETVNKTLRHLAEKRQLIRNKLRQVYYEYYVELPHEERFDQFYHEKLLEIAFSAVL